MSRLIAVLLIAALTPGCATIKSRDLTPTADQPRIQNDEFFRGDDEKLDEQEFYQLVGDRESYDAVRNPKLAARNSQFIWVALALVGIAAAGFGAANMILPKGGPLGDNGLFEPLFPNPADGSFNYIPYAITAGGAVLFGIGIGLLTSSASRVNPTELKFDIFHAKESARKAGIDPDAPAPNSYEGQRLANEKKLEIERLKYEEERKLLKRTDVANIELSSSSETFAFGPGGSIKHHFVNAKGERLDFIDTTGWVEWSSTPAGFVDADGNWSNPARADLKHLGVPLVVTAKLKETNVKASITFTPDLTRPARLPVPGRGTFGSSGSAGASGESGDKSRPRGGNGGPGGHGRDASGGGGTETAEAAFVQDARGESYLLVVSGTGDDLSWDLTDAKKARIHAYGPSGGKGGSGGSGGNGWTPYKDCDIPGDGGDGGDGGNGGNGGEGPKLIVSVPSQAVLDQLTLESEGGSAGAAGDAGGAGRGGYEQRCSVLKETYRGNKGRDGRAGKPGVAGDDGSVKTEIVKKNELESVNAFLKKYPAMRFDEDGLDTDELPSKKKGKKAR